MSTQGTGQRTMNINKMIIKISKFGSNISPYAKGKLMNKKKMMEVICEYLIL